MSSSDILSPSPQGKQLARRPLGLIALLGVFALCLLAVAAFLLFVHKKTRPAVSLTTNAVAASEDAAADAATKNIWAIRGALSETCTCSVPCSCNFGAGPSPHSYCWPFYSYDIREGSYNDIKLDGLHFGAADLSGGRTLFIDERADEEQRAALRVIIARMIIRVPEAEAEAKAKELASTVRYLPVKQDYDERSNHLEVSGLGEFSADYVMGLDKSQPVVVRNNTTWRIHDAIKARTSIYRIKAGHDSINTKDTNSNQGEFEYTNQTDFGGPAQWNCGACANSKAQSAQPDAMCGR
ncbi:MAG TPA: DUF1326 domain-containing protein [Pyrinomonadaceae bacterium]